MTQIKQYINITALYIKNVVDAILTIIINILTYIQNNINIYLNNNTSVLSTKQKLFYKGYGLLYSIVQICAIYTFLPCACIPALYSFCIIYSLETLSFMGVIKQRKLKNRYKWVYYFLKYGKIT